MKLKAKKIIPFRKYIARVFQGNRFDGTCIGTSETIFELNNNTIVFPPITLSDGKKYEIIIEEIHSTPISWLNRIFNYFRRIK